VTSTRTIAQEAHERLQAREAAEGDAIDLVRRVADAVSRRTGSTVTAEIALWIQVELALERHGRRPAEGEHLREAVANLSLLARLDSIELAEAAAVTGAWPVRRAP
jgi:hypothetical protein